MFERKKNWYQLVGPLVHEKLSWGVVGWEPHNDKGVLESDLWEIVVKWIPPLCSPCVVVLVKPTCVIDVCRPRLVSLSRGNIGNEL